MVLFPPPFYFVFDISNLLIISSYELARPIMGTIFLVGRAKRAPHWGVILRFRVIGKRAKRARHSQVCSIENRIYMYNYVIARAGVIFGIYFTSCRYSGGSIARGEAECYFAALPKTSAIYPRISRLPVL